MLNYFFSFRCGVFLVVAGQSRAKIQHNLVSCNMIYNQLCFMLMA